jgi:hypothetical protein
MATPDPLDPIRENLARNISDANKQLLVSTDIAKELSKALGDTSSVTRNIFENTTDATTALSETLDLASKLGTQYLKSEQVEKRITKNNTTLLKIETDMKNIVNNRLGQQLAIAKVEAAVLTGQTQSLSHDEVRLYLLEAQRKTFEGNKVLLDDINSRVEEGNDLYEKTRVKATALSKIFNSISKIPFLSEFMDFKLLADEFQNGFGKGMKALGGQLKTIFTSPLFGIIAVGTALVALIKSAAELDKKITAISNNLGISKDSTANLISSFRQASAEGAKFSQTLDSALMSITNQATALTDMQKTLETNSLFTREMIENQIMMTKQLGLSEEEAAGINKLSLLTGQSSEKILQTALSQNKTAVSYKKVMSEISKINAELSIAYKNNPELIAKAVIQANKLGMSLEQTQRISKSLLDFETSISGELESELLLGKQFNFEKARALALDGKSAEAATELVNQIGGINSLTQMNVIQRERLAAAIGLSAEELGNSAREQAVLNALGFQNKQALEEQYAILRANNDQAGLAKLQEEARKKEGGELLLQDIARLDLSTRFNETMSRLKEMIVSIVAGPLGRMLDGFTKLISNGPALQGIFNSLKFASIAAAAAFAIINPAGALAAASILGAGLIGYAMTDEETTGVKAGTAPQASLPTRNTSLPNYNNNQGGFNNNNNQNTGTNQNTQTTAHFYLEGNKFATAVAMSNHTAGA